MQKTRDTSVFALKKSQIGASPLDLTAGQGRWPAGITTKTKITTNYLLARPLLETDNFHELDLVQPSKVVYLH